MPKPINIPGYGAFIRADQMGIPASAGMMPAPAASTLQEAYFDGGDPTNSLLAQSVHGFMDANPQLGQNPNGGLPNRQMNRLFQSLLSKYYGNPNSAEAAVASADDPQLESLFSQYDEGYSPMYEGSSMASDFINAMGEPQANQESKELSNQMYAWDQPYGQDFTYDLQDGDPSRIMYAEPNGVVHNALGEVIRDPGPGLVDDDPEDIFGNVRKAALPMVRTAGSYALPMLFSMLMRGGK